MDIAITGVSGFIGTALSRSLRAAGHRTIAVTRSAPEPGSGDAISWDPDSGAIDGPAFEGLDAVVHLAGEPIASGRWTGAQRARIRGSRQRGTRLLATTLASLDRPPKVLVSGSAIGYYGDRGHEVLTEASGPGDDFLARVCVDWEGATASAEAADIRVAHVRTGIVLDGSGGALAKQLSIFKLGLGGKAGSGKQWMSWISLADQVSAIRYLLDHDQVRGPVNLTAPGAVDNATFTKALGAAVHRPTIVTIPRAVRRLPLGVGSLVDSLLFSSARVTPTVLLDAGFTFAHPGLESALAAAVAST